MQRGGSVHRHLEHWAPSTPAHLASGVARRGAPWLMGFVAKAPVRSRRRSIPEPPRCSSVEHRAVFARLAPRGPGASAAIIDLYNPQCPVDLDGDRARLEPGDILRVSMTVRLGSSHHLGAIGVIARKGSRRDHPVDRAHRHRMEVAVADVSPGCRLRSGRGSRCTVRSADITISAALVCREKSGAKAGVKKGAEGSSQGRAEER